MRFHIGTVVMLIFGLCAVIPGVMTLLGKGEWIHDLLRDPAGAIALLAIGGSCLFAAFFPMVVTYLTRKEQGKKPFEDQET